MSPQLSVSVLCGHPRPDSRTLGLALRLQSSLVELLGGGPGEVLDASVLAGWVFTEAPRVAERLATVTAADVVVVATPTFKGTHTALLKAVLENSTSTGWERTLAIPLQTVGSPAHALAADVHLRPLLVELGASVPTSSLVATERDLADGGGTLVAEWLSSPGGGGVLERLFGRPGQQERA